MLSVGREGRVGVGFRGGQWQRSMGPLIIYKADQVIQFVRGSSQAGRHLGQRRRLMGPLMTVEVIWRVPSGQGGCLGDPMGLMEMFDGSSDHSYYKTQRPSSWIFGTNGLWWGTNGQTDPGRS